MEKIDGRKYNGNKQMTEQQIKYMYEAFKNNYELLGSRDRESIKKRNKLYDDICKKSDCTYNSVNTYKRAYVNLRMNRPIGAAKIGIEILLYYLHRFEQEESEDFLKNCINHYYTWIVDKHRDEPLIVLRNECQEYSDRLKMDLDFFKNLPQKIKTKFKKYNDEDDLDNPVKDLSYKYDIGSLSIQLVDPPKFVKKINTDDDKEIIKTVAASSENDTAKKARNKKIAGNRGEKIALIIEKKILNELNIRFEPIHIARKKDGYGYDIISRRKNNNGDEYDIYIEVKATSGGIDTPFYISQNEIDASRKYRDKYYIYRIFGMSEKSDNIKCYIIQGDITEAFNLEPQIYIASRR